MGHSPPGSSVHGILQARILVWVACFSPGDFPNPGIQRGSPTLQATEPPGKPQTNKQNTPSHLLKVTFWDLPKENLLLKFHTFEITAYFLQSPQNSYLFQREEIGR